MSVKSLPLTEPVDVAGTLDGYTDYQSRALVALTSCASQAHADGGETMASVPWLHTYTASSGLQAPREQTAHYLCPFCPGQTTSARR